MVLVGCIFPILRLCDALQCLSICLTCLPEHKALPGCPCGQFPIKGIQSGSALEAPGFQPRPHPLTPRPASTWLGRTSTSGTLRVLSERNWTHPGGDAQPRSTLLDLQVLLAAGLTWKTQRPLSWGLSSGLGDPGALGCGSFLGSRKETGSVHLRPRGLTSAPQLLRVLCWCGCWEKRVINRRGRLGPGSCGRPGSGCCKQGQPGAWHPELLLTGEVAP